MGETGRRIPTEHIGQSKPEIVLLPEAGFIVPHAIMGIMAGAERFRQELLLNSLHGEYVAIGTALSYALNGDELKLVKSRIAVGKHTPKGTVYRTLEMPKGPADDIVIDFKQDGKSAEKVFLRDLFTNVNDELVFIDPLSLPNFKDDERIRKSPLGEGGKVLLCGKSMVISEDLWNDTKAKQDIRELQQRGYSVAYVPLVDVARQAEDKRSVVPGHIDGHVNLVRGADGNTYMIFASSYANQTGKTRDRLKKAAGYIGAQPIEIEDDVLPPLAMNFVQLKNGNVIVVGGDKPRKYNPSLLVNRLGLLVGPEKVYATTMQPINIVQIMSGGIRCLTNQANQEIVDRIVEAVADEQLYLPLN